MSYVACPRCGRPMKSEAEMCVVCYREKRRVLSMLRKYMRQYDDLFKRLAKE